MSGSPVRAGDRPALDDPHFRRLSELRHARHTIQVALAERLHMVQPSVSRLERQTDLYVSTLRRYIEAIGGPLEIHAVFPDLDAELRLDDFEASGGTDRRAVDH